MCHDVCKAIKSWFKSFTKLEILLTLLEALQLVLLIALLTFLILHFLACLQAAEYDAGHREFVNVSKKEQNGEAQHANNQTDDKDANEKSRFNFSGMLLPKKPYGDKLNGEAEGFVAALVELKFSPSETIIFRCILTIISEYWTVTAASCIGSFKVNSIDDVGIVIGYEDDNDTLDVTSIIIHPNYHHDTTHKYDLGALKSVGRLTENGKAALKLPTPLDFFVTTIGEGLTIVGFGKYRSVSSKESLTRNVYGVFVHVLPWRRCERNDDIELGAAEGDPASSLKGGDTQAMCVGTLSTPASERACRYCAGTPLLRERTLLALMVDWHRCARGCRPAQYVGLSQHVRWLLSVQTLT